MEDIYFLSVEGLPLNDGSVLHGDGTADAGPQTMEHAINNRFRKLVALYMSIWVYFVYNKYELSSCVSIRVS